jgi:UDP-N-acetylbacillosamine N-acetyltransferase
VSRPPLVVWGAGGHASVVADAVRLAGEYEIAGFLDDLHPERRGEAFCGATILGGEPELSPLRDRGVRHVILPGARVGGEVEVGRGALLGMSATVMSRVRIGPGAVVGAGALVLSDVPAATVVRGVPARIVAPEHA